MNETTKWKNSRLDKLEKQLKQWFVELEKLSPSDGKTGMETQTDYHRHIAELKIKHSAAQKKLNEARDSGGYEWKNF